MGNILVLDEFGSAADVEKQQVIHGKDGVDYGVFMYHKNRAEKHLLRGLLYTGMSDFVFSRSLKSEKIRLENYHLIIVNQLNRSPLLFLEYIRRKNPQCHLIYHRWNSLFYMDNASKKRKEIFRAFIDARERLDFQISSFDKADCDRYGFVYGSQYIPGGVEKYSNYQIEKDVFFVGKDKGRLNQIKKISIMLNSLGISGEYWVLPDNKRKKYLPDEHKYLISKAVPYEEIICQDQKAKAILDVVQKGQKGLTWRDIEALLLEKKLITTLKEISTYDFYSKDNIFIWGEDDISNLPAFINSPYRSVKKDIVEKYTFRGWIKMVYQEMGWNIQELK